MHTHGIHKDIPDAHTFYLYKINLGTGEDQISISKLGSAQQPVTPAPTPGDLLPTLLAFDGTCIDA